MAKDLRKPGMYQPESEIWKTQNITQLEIYSGPHVKVLVDLCGGHVIFRPPLRGKDAIPLPRQPLLRAPAEAAKRRASASSGGRILPADQDVDS